MEVKLIFAGVLLVIAIIFSIIAKIRFNKSRKSKDFVAMVEGYARRVVNQEDFRTDVWLEDNTLVFLYNADEFAGFKQNDKEYIVLRRAFCVPASRKGFLSELNKKVFANGVHLNMFPDHENGATIIEIVSPVELSYGRRWFKEIDGYVKYLIEVKDEIMSDYQEYNSLIH